MSIRRARIRGVGRAVRGGCAGIGLLALVAVVSAAGAASAAERVVMKRSIGFTERSNVRPAVREECQIQTRLPEFIQSYAQERGLEVELVDALPDSGRVLEVRVVDTVEMGNAFMGRQKGFTIEGTLRQDGEVVGTFRGRRTTGGGMFGGYKGTCAFFGRCAKALGKDVAVWLESPTMDAAIGGW